MLMGGGYLSLIYKLYKIKEEYSKERKLYKQTTKIFPNLIYPDIKTLNDYNDSIRVKFHLSYMLGETLIKADKNKFKGGYLTLFKDIKQTHKDYKTIKQLLSDFNTTSPTIYNAIADNKEIFIKNLNKIENILKTHKDYQAIIDNILHNFDYFLNHSDLIKKWLLSDDFNEKYKKENHPYPSLLDPKKLNDENEEINYNNIPAELAWKMNLPLPDRYEFVFLFNSCSGSEAIQHFFYLCDVETRAWSWYSAEEIFKLNYIHMLDKKKSAPCMPAIISNDYFDKGNYEKNFFLLNKKCYVFFIVRDPISIIKTALNHIDNLHVFGFKSTPLFNNINYKNYSFDTLFPKILYAYSNSYKVNIKDIVKVLDNTDFYFTLNKRILMLKNIIKDVVCINFDDIKSENILSTLIKLSNKFSFKKPNSMYDFIFKSKINTYEGLTHFPVNINIFNIRIMITTPYLLSIDKKNIKRFENITKIFFNSEFILDNVIIVCDKDCVSSFLNNKNWNEFKEYIVLYINALSKYIQSVKNNLVSEKDVLTHLKKHKQLAIKFKKYIDENLFYIKKEYPYYVKNWKYYQEFEKMCEELDDEEKIKKSK
ncbi:DUF2972 domain-containing protein [Campylobacter armoricus]|uniref:DUF2972 domain-containing protein n=1 Tax=Campylobacter armoricus TaxID=2505970 RepID=UPI001F271329|nr:DUF2972 domain-containing protein [Campylobacter armoricus]